MPCTACGHDNPTAAQFCNSCGAALVARCAACGGSNPPAARFCNQCGAAVQVTGAGSQVSGPDTRPPAPDPRSYTPKHLADKILQSKSAIEGERKQVTVLFADVKGSLELAEQVDPEEWHRILDRFFQILSDGVHRFEGTVNQYTGDGIMALFGAPIAHEDHAQRACYAALYLRDELRRYAQELRRTRSLDFRVRMGLNCGEVIVGAIGNDLRMDYAALGHAVGLAQRMEQLAEPGKVYLTEATAAVVRGYFTLEDLGEFAVKGASTPLRVFALEGVGTLRTRLDIARARGFSRLVGRTDEMAALELALKQATDGRGQVVGIVGEPGVGKSRLCFEFTERCRARGVPVYDAHCPAHGKTLPFVPMLELLRSYFGITDADGDDAARKKIAGTLVLVDPAFQEVLPLVFDFLGVPDPERPAARIDPEARQRQLFALVRRLLQHRARDAAILLLDDVHWIDPASDAFLAQLVDTVPGTHFLLLLNFRPEYRAAWMGKSSYQQLPLYPLGPAAAAQLLAELLGSDSSVGKLAPRIAERTGGNPFFIEEVVQALVEADRLTGAKGAYRLAASVDAITIPATVQAVLAARIDRLSEREKALLQAAAVIGKEFTEPVLAEVLGAVRGLPLQEPDLRATLDTLTTAEFLYQQALYPVAEYTFKHPLTQEVAYHSQLHERRGQVHAAVARAIAAEVPTKLDERAALLADHWEQAGEPLTAADWHRRAAEWVGGRDRTETRRHWQRVRALLLAVPESQETLALGVLARAQMIRNDIYVGQQVEQAATLFAEGIELARRLGHPPARVRLLAAYGFARWHAGASDEAISHLSEALRLADEAGDDVASAYTRWVLAVVLSYCGRLREGLARLAESEALSGADPDFGAPLAGFSFYGTTLAVRGMVLMLMGRLAEAAQLRERAIELAQGRRDVEVLRTAHMAGVVWSWFTGDPVGALHHGHRFLELADATAGGVWAIEGAKALGQALLLNEQWSDAVVALEEALARMRERHLVLYAEPEVLANLAEAVVALGDCGRARALADEAVTTARQRGIMGVDTLLTRARVRRLCDGTPAAAAIEADLEHAIAEVERTDAWAFAPFIHVERAEVARLLGDEVAYQRELHEAHRLFAAMGATGHVSRIEGLIR